MDQKLAEIRKELDALRKLVVTHVNDDTQSVTSLNETLVSIRRELATITESLDRILSDAD